MKKFQVVLLILILIFTLSSCGNDDISSDDQLSDSPIVSEGDTEAEDEGNTGGNVTVLNPEDLTMAEEAYSDGEVSFDFNAEVTNDFPMSGCISKVDYSNITGLGSVLQSNFEKSVKSGFKEKNFEAFTDYEEYDGEDIDKICYVMAMENNDTDSAFIETGAYHDSTDNSNHQYITYFTKTYTSVNSFDLDSTISELKKFGATVSKSKLKSGVEKTFKSIGKDQYEYTLVETVPVKESNYSGYVKVGVYGGEMEDGTIAVYAICERDIVYK